MTAAEGVRESVPQRGESSAALFVDGFQSNWEAAVAWADAFAQHCSAARAVPSIIPFSYAAPGQPYGPEQTFDSLAVTTPLVAQHIAAHPDLTTVVGYSLGGVVATHGVAALLPGNSSRISRLILVAAAFQPDPAILVAFQFRARGGRATIPAVIAELCGADPEPRDAVRAALMALIEKGIHVYELYSRDDTYTPYVGPTISVQQRVFYHPLPLDIPRTERNAREYHMRLRTHDRTLTTICNVLGQATDR